MGGASRWCSRGCGRRSARWIGALSATAAVIGAGLLPAGSAAATLTVDAGSLRARVSESPWRLWFVDRAGRSVLAERPRSASRRAGPLGFRTPDGYFRATRATSARRRGKALLLDVRTSDPSGRRIRVRIEPDGAGVVRVSAAVAGSASEDVQALGASFAAARGERFWGFGERSNAVDQRGRTVENQVEDGPFEPADRQLLRATIPPWGFGERDDSTYYPLPWLLSSRGVGVLVDNDERSRFRLGSDRRDAWSLEADARRLSFRVFAGPRPLDALRRFSSRTGRQPPPPAPWLFGPWFQTGQANEVPLEQESEYVRLLQDADAPISAAETHMRWLPCGDHRGREAGERARTRMFHRRGLAVLTYFNPELCSDYQPLFDEAAAAGALGKDSAGRPYTYGAFVGGESAGVKPVGQFDFTAPSGRAIFDRLLGEAVAVGHDGWMEDFGEYTPPDLRSADGTPPERMHNRYPTTYHCSAAAFARRQPRPIVRFQRSGWLGSTRCADAVWGGDPTTDWGFDGLRSVVTQALSVGMSGVSRWGSDIGGYFSIGGDERLTRELLVRWIQLGAASGVMRTKAGGVAAPAYERPQIWEPQQLPLWRRYAKLRTQLYPYLAAADARYRRTGMPTMGHLALSYPADRRAAAREDEYLLGPDLLVAPVLRPGAHRRTLYLPPGRWIDLWRSVEYERGTGGLRLGRARLLRGARELTLPAPLDQLPLLVRAGAVLPLLPPDVDTLSGYGSASDIVHLDDRRGRLELLAFPARRASASFYARERLRSVVRPGSWTLRIDGRRTRRYRLQASTVALRSSSGRRNFRPCAVSLAGRPLAARSWSFSAAQQRLTVAFRARAARLTVSERCR